jgi:hypothetical protein
LLKIHFLRKFVAYLETDNKTDLFRLSDKPADGFFQFSFFEKISQAPPACHRDYAGFDPDRPSITVVVHQA